MNQLSRWLAVPVLSALLAHHDAKQLTNEWNEKRTNNWRVVGGRYVEFLEIEFDALEMLSVLKSVNEIATADAGDVRERVIGTVHNARRSFFAEDRLVAFGAPHVLAVVATNEICRQKKKKQSDLID